MKPGSALDFHQTIFETDVVKILACLEVSYLGDLVYDWDIGTEIKRKGEKDLTRSSKSRSNETKVNAVSVLSILPTSDSPDTYCTRTSTKRTPNIISLSVTPSDWAIAAGRIGEEKVDEREEKLEIDYQIGEDI